MTAISRCSPVADVRSCTPLSVDRRRQCAAVEAANEKEKRVRYADSKQRSLLASNARLTRAIIDTNPACQEFVAHFCGSRQRYELRRRRGRGGGGIPVH